MRGGGRIRQGGVGFCSRPTPRVALRGCVALAPMTVTGASLSLPDASAKLPSQSDLPAFVAMYYRPRVPPWQAAEGGAGWRQR